jgi:hypothetical protein
MNWITGPNRAYGIGETKSQNAVIKVYSAAELKAALTKVYQLPSGVGTIEIAGDIVITEPIKLKQFSNATREIIIQCAAGARIINGTTGPSSRYNYNLAGYNYIPVFDLGTTDNTSTNLCKYTFKDLTLNSQNTTSFPFGAFVAYGLGSTDGNAGAISIINLKANKLGTLFAAYNSSGTFTSSVTMSNMYMQDFVINNVSMPTAVTGTYITSPQFKLESANIVRTSRLNPLAPVIGTNDILFFNASNNLRCTVMNSLAPITIQNTGSGLNGNTFINCYMTRFSAAPYVTLLNCYNLSTTTGIGGATHVSTAGDLGYDSRNAFKLYNNDSRYLDTSIHSIVNINTFETNNNTINVQLVQGVNQIEWNLTFKYPLALAGVADAINTYKIITTIRWDALTSAYSIVSNSTINASELLTTTTITPGVSAGGIVLTISDSFTNYRITGSIVVIGNG